MPGMTDERLCLESPTLPLIATIALLIQYQPHHGSVFIFPFTGEDMAVFELRSLRRRKGIQGHGPMNRRLIASCHEHGAGEKERSNDVP